jgi:hypothetical protein
MPRALYDSEIAAVLAAMNFIFINEFSFYSLNLVNQVHALASCSRSPIKTFASISYWLGAAPPRPLISLVCNVCFPSSSVVLKWSKTPQVTRYLSLKRGAIYDIDKPFPLLKMQEMIVGDQVE